MSQTFYTFHVAVVFGNMIGWKFNYRGHSVADSVFHRGAGRSPLLRPHTDPYKGGA